MSSCAMPYPFNIIINFSIMYSLFSDEIQSFVHSSTITKYQLCMNVHLASHDSKNKKAIDRYIELKQNFLAQYNNAVMSINVQLG